MVVAITPHSDRAPTRQWTVDEVMRMVDFGILAEDEKLELLDGELVVVTPQGPAHGNTVSRMGRVLHDAYRGIGFVRPQVPMVSGERSLPEPDLAVGPVAAPWEREDRHPRCDELFLLVEVVVTTHTHARRKAPIYAAGGAEEFWIVDVPKRRVTVHTRPTREGVWGAIIVVDEPGELALPRADRLVTIADLLPSGTAVGSPIGCEAFLPIAQARSSPRQEP